MSRRVAWRSRSATDSDLPPGDQEVCHSCDNPPCCNPAHPWLGTAAENSADSVTKARKLTPEQVLAIASSTDSPSALAIRFGVTPNMVGKIQLGRSWTGITGGPTRQPSPSYGRRRLDADGVRAIRASDDSARDLAQRFGLSTAMVSRVRAGTSWRSVS